MIGFFVGVAGAEPYALNVFLSVIYRNDPNLGHLLVLILFGITNIRNFKNKQQKYRFYCTKLYPGILVDSIRNA